VVVNVAQKGRKMEREREREKIPEKSDLEMNSNDDTHNTKQHLEKNLKFLVKKNTQRETDLDIQI
jgi:hypothetical protein